MLDRFNGFEPDEHRYIIGEIFGADTAIGTQEIPEVVMKRVDMLQMPGTYDLGPMIVGIVRGVRREDHMGVAVVLKVFAGSSVIVGQKHSLFLVDVFLDGSIQHGLRHEADTGDGCVKALVAILNHAEHAGLFLRGSGLVVRASFV